MNVKLKLKTILIIMSIVPFLFASCSYLLSSANKDSRSVASNKRNIQIAQGTVKDITFLSSVKGCRMIVNVDPSKARNNADPNRILLVDEVNKAERIYLYDDMERCHKVEIGTIFTGVIQQEDNGDLTFEDFSVIGK